MTVAAMMMGAAAGCVVQEAPLFPAAEGALEAQLQLALGYLRAGQEERARRRLEQLAHDHPNAAQVDDALGVFYLSRRQWRTAERHLRAALRKDKHYAAARNNYAALLFRQQRYPEAEQQLQQALQDQRYARRASVHSNLARVQLRLGRYAEAQRRVRRALEIDANHAPSWLVLAELHVAQQQYQQAHQALRRHWSLSAATVATLHLAIKVARAQKDWRALAHYHRRLHELEEQPGAPQEAPLSATPPQEAPLSETPQREAVQF